MKNESEMQLQESKFQFDIYAMEYEYMGEFIDQAVTGDMQRRLSIAKYFSLLSVSEITREHWKDYYEYLKKQTQETIDSDVSSSSSEH